MTESAQEAAPRSPLSAHVALGAAQLGFGLFPVFGKLVFPPPLGQGHIGPLALAALRAAFGALSLTLVANLAGAGRVERRSDLVRLAMNAFFGVVLNQVLYLVGLSRSSATHAGVLVAATPAIAYALAIALRRETARPGPAAGVLLAIAGAAWIALVRPIDSARAGSPTLEGDALLAANMVSYAIYLVLMGDVLTRVDPLRAIAWIFFFGALVNVPLGIPDLLAVPWASVTPRTWGALAFILVFPTSVCYALNTFALKRASATVVAVYTTSQPVVASVSAAIVLQERPPVIDTVCATALILLGVVTVAFRRRARQSPR
ncbi:DMT family transporter [bacterium]|nr:DMT family transporter [bacterium]